MSDDAFPVTWDDPADAELSWEWDDMHMPRALTPLAGEYVCRSVSHGLTYRWERAGMPMRMECRIINGYAYYADRLLVPREELPAVMARGDEFRRARVRVTRQYWEEEVLPALMSTYAWIRGLPVEAGALPDLAAAWDDMWGRVPHLWGMHFMTNAGSYQSLNDLADFYESVMNHSHPGEALTLVQGMPSDLQQVERDLYRLAEHARAVPAVAEAIARDPAAALGVLVDLEEAAGFLGGLREFLALHGHLGQAFDDLALASWADEPWRLMGEIRKRLLHPEEDPEVRRGRLAHQAEETADRVRERLRDRPEELRRFAEVLALAREVGPLTENHNYWLDRMLHAHLHRLCMRLGSRLVAEGVLTAPGDIFFLHADEVGASLRQPRDRRHLVIERAAAHDHWSRVRPPKYLGALPEQTGTDRFDAPAPQQVDAAVLRGTGACAGRGRGPARVVRDADDFSRVEAGDVLVCPSSNPSWVPLFGIIAGLVTNTGGVLSHAAVVAREFGVPAVVGTGVATERIRDGRVVEVDGTKGEVRLL